MCADLRRAFASALAALDLRPCTRAALRGVDLTHSTVIAWGKCAAPMLAGALDAGAIGHAIVVRPDRSQALDAVTRASLGAALDEYVAGHPLPDARSVRAGEALLAAVHAADDVQVLLSGGASATGCVPIDGLTAYRAAIDALFADGAPIARLNAARGRLDRLKHGGLTRAARPGRMRALIASDVLGSPETMLATIGSAPTLGAANTLVAMPYDAREALARALAHEEGIATVTTLPDLEGDLDAACSALAAEALALAPGAAAVAVGEVTVVLPRDPGRGGRAGRLALRLASALRGHPDLTALVAATDGVDGASPFAGAVITGASWDEAVARGLDPDGALAAFADADLHGSLGTAVDTGPTGLNLLDLVALVRAPAGIVAPSANVPSR